MSAWHNYGKFRLKRGNKVYYLLFGFIPIYLFTIYSNDVVGIFYNLASEKFEI